MDYLLAAAVFDGSQLVEDHFIALEDGFVRAIVPRSDVPAAQQFETSRAVVSPGLFDIQVNGGGGTLLNNDPTAAGVRRIAETHNRLGTSRLLPTVITDSYEIMERACFAVLDEFGRNGVTGIHIEGPHINPLYKGAHDPGHIREFDGRTMGLLEKLRSNGLPVLLTLAPEMVPRGLIAQLTERGVVVSAGHTGADAYETRRAIREGLRCFTHLFNAMPALTSRNPIVTGTAINSEVWCSVISDGHHVDDDTLALTVRARPIPDRMILISDAMPTVGGPEEFQLYGDTITVSEGRLIHASGLLAGAHVHLAGAVRRAVEQVGLPMRDVLRMATVNPFEMMTLPVMGMIGEPVESLFFLPIESRALEEHVSQSDCAARRDG